MTPADFLKWINIQIGLAISDENGIRAGALVEAKEKYLSILPPPQSTY